MLNLCIKIIKIVSKLFKLDEYKRKHFNRSIENDNKEHSLNCNKVPLKSAIRHVTVCSQKKSA